MTSLDPQPGQGGGAVPRLGRGWLPRTSSSVVALRGPDLVLAPGVLGQLPEHVQFPCAIESGTPPSTPHFLRSDCRECDE